MKIEITWVRHGKTAGNLEGRYIGVTDEPLCDEGRRDLLQKSPFPMPEILYSSPMKRCLETAAILYPHRKPLILSAFRECDFGDFEGKNYAELNGQSDYQRFIDHIGGIPHGETPTNFQKRCCEGFLDMGKNLREKDAKTVSVVCHGGIIMAVFDRFEVGKKGFYGYQVKNGCGFRTAFDPDTNALTILEEY